MPEGKVTPETKALEAISSVEKETQVHVPLPGVSLEPGRHVLAAEIHQANENSSDILFDVALSYPPVDRWRTPESSSSALEFLSKIDPDHELFPWTPTLRGEETRSSPGGAAHRAFAIHLQDLLGAPEQAMEMADERLSKLKESHARGDVGERMYWLTWKKDKLRALGRPESEVAEILREITTAPPRPPGLDPKQLDLSAFYNASLYTWGTGQEVEGYGLGRLPLSFTPLHGVEFDLRGVIQLNSGGIPSGSSAPNQRPRDINERLGRDYPDQVTGIPVNQATEALHFLMSCRWGRETSGNEVAHYLVHYNDGTTEKAPISYPDDVADWVQSGENDRLPEERIGWRGMLANGTNERVLSEVVWKNPHPQKTVSTIDFVSSHKAAAPFLIAITLE